MKQRAEGNCIMCGKDSKGESRCGSCLKKAREWRRGKYRAENNIPLDAPITTGRKRKEK